MAPPRPPTHDPHDRAHRRAPTGARRRRRPAPPACGRRPARAGPAAPAAARCCSLLALLLAAAARARRLVVRLGPLHLHAQRPGPGQAAAVEKIEAAGLEPSSATGRTPRPSAPAGSSPPTRTPASRVLDGGTVTRRAVAGQGAVRRPEAQGLTEDEAQDALLATQPVLRQAHREVVRDRARGHRDRQRPQGRHHAAARRRGRPGRQQGPQADRRAGLDRQGRRPAEAALEAKGLEVDRGAEEYSDTVPEGDVISQSPSSGTLYRGDTVRLVVSKGPELVEVPGGLVASGVDAATERLEALGFEVDVEERRRVHRPRLRLLGRPGLRARWRPRAARSRCT